tara:strand:+ start:3320 stop:3634 length:315 start_codon:yes stop_codon:yes gene_type:complete
MVELTNENLTVVKDVTGYISLVLLSLLYIPQTVYIYYNKNTIGITKLFLVLGIALTIDTMVYGYLLNELPLMISNAIAMICLILMIIAKFLYPSRPIVKEIITV